MSTPRVTFSLRGMMAGVALGQALAPGVFVYGMVFGVLAGEAHLSALEAVLMSAGRLHRGRCRCRSSRLGFDFMLVAFSAAMAVAMWRGRGDLPSVLAALVVALVCDRFFPAALAVILVVMKLTGKDVVAALAGVAVVAILRASGI